MKERKQYYCLACDRPLEPGTSVCPVDMLRSGWGSHLGVETYNWNTPGTSGYNGDSTPASPIVVCRPCYEFLDFTEAKKYAEVIFDLVSDIACDKCGRDLDTYKSDCKCRIYDINTWLVDELKKIIQRQWKKSNDPVSNLHNL